MAIEAVREYMKQWGVQDRILEFEVSSATVELAAQAVGCQPALPPVPASASWPSYGKLPYIYGCPLSGLRPPRSESDDLP